jgi:hypothetical protein
LMLTTCQAYRREKILRKRVRTLKGGNIEETPLFRRAKNTYVARKFNGRSGDRDFGKLAVSIANIDCGMGKTRTAAYIVCMYRARVPAMRRGDGMAGKKNFCSHQLVLLTWVIVQKSAPMQAGRGEYLPVEGVYVKRWTVNAETWVSDHERHEVCACRRRSHRR